MLMLSILYVNCQFVLGIVEKNIFGFGYIKWKLICFRQSFIFVNSSFITVLISLLSVFLKIILSVPESVVLSAYNIKSNILLTFVISFIYNE